MGGRQALSNLSTLESARYSVLRGIVMSQAEDHEAHQSDPECRRDDYDYECEELDVLREQYERLRANLN